MELRGAFLACVQNVVTIVSHLLSEPAKFLFKFVHPFFRRLLCDQRRLFQLLRLLLQRLCRGLAAHPIDHPQPLIGDGYDRRSGEQPVANRSATLWINHFFFAPFAFSAVKPV